MPDIDPFVKIAMVFIGAYGLCFIGIGLIAFTGRRK